MFGKTRYWSVLMDTNSDTIAGHCSKSALNHAFRIKDLSLRQLSLSLRQLVWFSPSIFHIFKSSYNITELISPNTVCPNSAFQWRSALNLTEQHIFEHSCVWKLRPNIELFSSLVVTAIKCSMYTTVSQRHGILFFFKGILNRTDFYFYKVIFKSISLLCNAFKWY